MLSRKSLLFLNFILGVAVITAIFHLILSFPIEKALIVGLSISLFLDLAYLQLNVTWINNAIDLGNVSCSNGSCCSCENDTCPAMLYSVDVNEVYNVSEKGKVLKLLNITVYNESFSYSFHVLAYQVEKEQYNLSVVTKIMPVNDTNLFTTVVNIDPRDDKAQPVADIVFFTNKTTLSDHYRLIGNVLNEIRKKDETKWIWGKG